MPSVTKAEALLVAYENALSKRAALHRERYEATMNVERERIQAELRQHEYHRELADRERVLDAAVAEARAALLTNVRESAT